MPVIPALKRQGQKNHKFEAIVDFILRSCLKNKIKKGKTDETNFNLL